MEPRWRQPFFAKTCRFPSGQNSKGTTRPDKFFKLFDFVACCDHTRKHKRDNVVAYFRRLLLPAMVLTGWDVEFRTPRLSPGLFCKSGVKTSVNACGLVLCFLLLSKRLLPILC